MKTLAGKLVFNPYGNWDDVDKGYYLETEYGLEKIESNFYDSLLGKNIKITIEELSPVSDNS